MTRVSELALRLLERVHGHLGVLTAAALAHPAIVLRRPGRRANLAVGLAAGLPVMTAALGIALYPTYRERLKQGIFIDARGFGYAFERKEHLAFGVVALALCGAAAYVRGRAGDADPRVARAAHIAFVAAFAMAIATACLGTAVASFRSF